MEKSEDAERVKSHQERPLLLFRTALNAEQEQELNQNQREDFQNERSNGDTSLKQGNSRNATWSLFSTPKVKGYLSTELPPLHRHDEATPSELFYDLFFVANLASYTAALSNNKIINIEGLANYIGFFCVMWFTWYQVVLYDVRFSRDSVFDRICKTGQFGVMAGFSFVAVNFDPAGQNSSGATGDVDGKAFSLIIMASRFILAIQYTVTMLTFWKYRAMRVPTAIGALGYLVAGFIFLAVSFRFGPDGALPGNHYAYITWYIVSVAESMTGMVVACFWGCASFKGTHLCERMSLLTLIVLGEGILGLSRGIGYVWKNTEYYSSLGGAIISVIVLLYSFFQLYFDTVAQDHFGSIRQQFWAFLHFPLHLALIVFDEGLKQFIIWNTAIKQQFDWANEFITVPIAKALAAYPSTNATTNPYINYTTEYFQAQAKALNQSLFDFTNSSSGKNTPSYIDYSKITKYLYDVGNGTEISSYDKTIVATSDIYAEVAKASYKTFSISTDPKDNSIAPGTSTIGQFFNGFGLYDMVFRYFYIGTGCALLLILLLWLISKRSKNDWFDYLRYGVWFAVGTTITLLSLLDLNENLVDLIEGFANTPWVLPVPMILTLFLLIVFHLPFGENRRRR